MTVITKITIDCLAGIGYDDSPQASISSNRREYIVSERVIEFTLSEIACDL